MIYLMKIKFLTPTYLNVSVSEKCLIGIDVWYRVVWNPAGSSCHVWCQKILGLAMRVPTGTQEQI